MSVTNDNSVFNPLTHQPPKYDIFGRLKKISFIPGINKNNILSEKENIHIPWLESKMGDAEPKTRTHLIETRKKERIPDISYDLDRDGFVGGKDYVLAKRFDLDGDGKLNEIEKKLAYEAIYNNIEDKYVWNLENQGPNRKLRVLQKRGKIIQGDDFMPIKETYPIHPLSSKLPRHESFQKLKESRKMNSKLDVEGKMKRWEDANPPVLVSEPLNINMDYKPKYNSTKEKNDEYHRMARINCGLKENEEEIDVKGKNKEVSLNYVKSPKYKTRADLKNDNRKEIMQQLNKSINPNHKDEMMRLKEREDEIFAMMYNNNGESVSLAKLKEGRKKEKIDYNLKTFSKQTIGVHGHELPKFSESEEMKEYWKFRDGYVDNPKINSHIQYKENVKYWKKSEELLINEHQEDALKSEFNKGDVLTEKKDNLIIKVNKLNHFKDQGFDPDNPKPIDIDEIPKNHIYKWSTLVNQFAPQKFRKGRFFDSLIDANRAVENDLDSSIFSSQKDAFQSEHMKKIVSKKAENFIKTVDNDKSSKDAFGQESLYQKLSLNNKDQWTKNEQPKTITIRTKAF